ncbi:MAG TPA: TIGR02302 family protein, partial [Hyphomicrobiaceae bacterium]|nr:TIGR02302 family protein [Hyphomicrobiaceae bacterium]
HYAVLALFAAALLGALVFAARTPWPRREEAVRRIERVSGAAHRPASSYEDTMSAVSSDGVAEKLWRVHRARLAKVMKALRVGQPAPRTFRFDPYALRALAVLALVVVGVGAGPQLWPQLKEAFRFSDARMLAAARLDAWVTPPGYTGKAPIMLADGARDPAAGPLPAATGALVIPTRSLLIVRSSGASALSPELEILGPGSQTPERITTESAKTPANAAPAMTTNVTAGSSGVSELRYELTHAARVRVVAKGSEMAAWTFDVTPDLPPEIALTKTPERSARGALKLTYKVKDDYGVTSAEAHMVKVPPKPDELEKTVGAWATKKLSGPRPPHERPPVLTLKLPRAGAKEAETSSHLELGSHPWAGLKVQMWLEAKDVAGQTGTSEKFEIILPQRRFDNPIARAVIEQRRKLVEDPRYRPDVLLAIEALTLEPEGFLDDVPAYLGLRMAYHRLKRSAARDVRNGVIEQLWHVAVRLEDGDLSDAERRLREAQEKLSKLLEEGASDQDIADAMKELRQALNDYMREFAQQNQENQNYLEGQNKNQQFLSSRDLEQMMKNIEEMAKNGSREQAQQMLSELRDLLDRLQSSKQSAQQNEKSREMMQKMDELGDLVGKQQQLMDDTFSQMRKDGDNSRRGESRRQRQGQQEGRQEGQQGQRGQQGKRGQQGQRGEQGQNGKGQKGQGGESQPGEEGLGDRQRALRDELDRLQRGLDELGLGRSDQLDSAREAMENAEKALGGEDYQTATDEQARALDQMRKGAQEMAKQMLQNMPQRYGQNGDTPRDPLGRPQRSQGPDPGASVKVPDEIDRQRAREILEELRRRIGEQTRPPTELDYIERLLRRF